VSDWSEAEDLAQDVLEEFVAASRLMEPIEQAAAWLMRVARNRIIDRYRARAREARLFDRGAAVAGGEAEDPERLTEQWMAPAADEPESAYERERLLEELEAALDELPEAQRAVFVAHEFEGRSFRELAAASGESINTLLGRKHDAVTRLRTRLEAWRIERDE
jgi:RNA polymerase sigma factor (sigma-70 family)